MKTKEILADMIAGTFDVEACANALKEDARALIRARNAQTNEAKKSCWTEQTGKYASAHVKYMEHCTKNNIEPVYASVAITACFNQDPSIAGFLNLSGREVHGYDRGTGSVLAQLSEQRRIMESAQASVRKHFEKCYDVVMEHVQENQIKEADLANPRPLSDVATEVTIETVLHALMSAGDASMESPAHARTWHKIMSDALDGYKPHRDFNISFVTDFDKFMVIFVRVASAFVLESLKKGLAPTQDTVK